MEEIEIEMGVTPEVVKPLITAAGQWHMFCLSQPRTEEQKRERINPCQQCKLNETGIGAGFLCLAFQEFNRLRKETIERRLSRINTDVEALELKQEKLREILESLK